MERDWHFRNPSSTCIMAGQILCRAESLPGFFQLKQICDTGGADVFSKSNGWPSGRLSSVPSSVYPTEADNSTAKCWGGNSGQLGKIPGMTNAWDD